MQTEWSPHPYYSIKHTKETVRDALSKIKVTYSKNDGELEGGWGGRGGWMAL
jgi:hypothetical protein